MEFYNIKLTFYTEGTCLWLVKIFVLG